MVRILCLLLILLLSASCGNDNSSTPNTWTILVYMDGDNNLDQAALEDIAEMEMVGSSDNVNIVVQLDLKGGFTTKRYFVKKGAREILEDLGELDMAAPQTITDFLVWAKDAYPADRTVLILWNHGNGWDQGDGPSVLSSPKRSIFYDEDNNGPNAPFLSNFKVRNAIKDSGIKIDILGLDASIMGTIEALYEFRDLAPIIITSQEVGESHGWDYAGFLSSLEANPGMTGEDLSKVVVDAYKAFFENAFYPANPNKEKLHNISAMRTGPLSLIGQEVDFLAARTISLLEDPPTRDQTLNLIRGARDSVQEIDYYVQPYVYVDLVDLERLLNQDTIIADLLSDATIAEYHGSARPNAHGVSIVFFKPPDPEHPEFPDAWDIYTYDPNYKDYDSQANTGNGGDFINQFQWDELLQRYYDYEGLI